MNTQQRKAPGTAAVVCRNAAASSSSGFRRAALRGYLLAGILFAAAFTELPHASAAAFAPSPAEAQAFDDTSVRPDQRESAVAQTDEHGRQHFAVGDMRFAGSELESAMTGNLWVGGRVYYVFDANISEQQRQLWRAAAAEWGNIGAVSFTEATGEGNYIQVSSSTVNSSYVGMVGGAQAMNISDWWQKWIIVHEIGHALGLVHEHCRSDRDTYVKILWQNIIAGEEYNFYSRPSRNYGTYDFESVMHYPRTAGSSNGGNTIEPQAAYRTYLTRMGAPTRLSQSDRSAITQRYSPGAISPPSVRNLGATDVTQNSAVIHAKILSDGGRPVQWRHFFYGPSTTGPEHEVYDENITVSGDSFSAAITGLAPNTTYYFQAYASNGSDGDFGYGPGWGSSEKLGEFTTLPTPTPTPSPTPTPPPSTPPPSTYSEIRTRWYPAGSGTVRGEGYYPVGSNQTVTAEPNFGWKFLHWNDGNSENPRIVNVPAQGITLGALFGESGEPTAQPLNIATRLDVPGDERNPIAGFIVSGSVAKRVLVRGIGPSLAQAGVTGVLVDPVLMLTDGNGDVIATNNNWEETQKADIFASGLAPTDPREAAHIASLMPGHYTTQLSGRDGSSGIALVEVYDLDANAPARLANISTRGLVGVGEQVMIGGFIMGGANSAGKIVVRALGPSLTSMGVPGVLANPLIELFDSNGNSLKSNDDWHTDQTGELMTIGLAPPSNHEAALVTVVPPGNYTAVVRSADASSTGIALVEIYDLF